MQLEVQIEQPRLKIEQYRLEFEQSRLKIEQSTAGLRSGILAALEARGLALDDDLQARVLACDDPAILQRWLLRALSATAAIEVFSA